MSAASDDRRASRDSVGRLGSAIPEAHAGHHNIHRRAVPLFSIHPPAAMTWQETAKAKRESLLQAIPLQWRLTSSQIPPCTRLPDVTGFIRQHLDPAELVITNSSADIVLQRIRTGDWSATEVTRAFCHRASLAHQLVRLLSPMPTALLMFCIPDELSLRNIF